MAEEILLLDDDAVQGLTRKAILESAGHRAAVASEAKKALSLLQSPEGQSIRMVITDHVMPGMNGPEFVKTLRQSGFSIPVLVLSGYPDVEDQYDALGISFRVKPFPPEQLIELVRYLLDTYERRSA